MSGTSLSLSSALNASSTIHIGGFSRFADALFLSAPLNASSTTHFTATSTFGSLIRIEGTGTSTILGRLSISATSTMAGYKICTQQNKVCAGGAFSSSGGFTTLRTATDLVGIGTSTPAEKLSLNGGAFFDSDIIRYGSSSAPTLNFRYFTSSTSTIPNLTSAFTFATSTTNTPLFTLSTKSSRYGRVGIGTSSPSALFAINALNASNQADNIFYVGSSTQNTFIIDNHGNVGIGATTTDNKLNVSGTINSWSFKKGGTAFNGVPTGAISYFTGSCPSGWTEYTSARGRVVVGLPLSGTAEGTVGTALTNLQDPTHTHTYTAVINHTHSVTITDPGHTHLMHTSDPVAGDTGFSATPWNSTVGVRTTGSNTTGITASTANPAGGVTTGTTAATSATMPYIQLRACQAPTGADYAERFSTRDGTLSAGELVSLDPKNPRMVKRMESQEALIGVVSTAPGSLIGDVYAQDGKDGIFQRPIALKGRAPVKVSLENGPLLIGDRLAPSKKKPGFGAKAIDAGFSVGFAMQNFDGMVRNEKGIMVDTAQEGVIEVFVDLGWYNLDYSAQPLPDGTGENKNTFWQSFSVDPNNFFFKPTYGLDLGGNGIENLGSINTASSTASWRIDKDGTFTARHIIAQDAITIGTPEKPSGIEFIDVKTKQTRCSVFLNGALKSFIGECSQENIARVANGNFLTFDTQGKSAEEPSSHLDAAVSSLAQGTLQSGWTIDQTTGRLTTTYGLDLGGNSIQNVSAILSASGRWRIGEDGKVVVREIEADTIRTKTLQVGDPSTPLEAGGITIYDRVTGNPRCAFFVNDIWTSEPGECGLATPEPSPPPTP